MTYKTSPRRSEFVRLVARLIFCVGAIIAIWLIAPTAAHALEPSTDLDDPLSDGVPDAADSAEATLTGTAGDLTDSVTDQVDSAEVTVTGAAGDLTDSVTDDVDSAEVTVTGAAGDLTDSVADTADSGQVTATATGAELTQKTVTEAAADRTAEIDKETASSATGALAGAARDASESLRDLTDDPASTLEVVRDAATDLVRPLQDTAPTVLDGMSTVVATIGAVTALDTSGPPDRDGDVLVLSGDGRRITTVPSGNGPSFAIRGPPLSIGAIPAAATSDGGLAPTSSSDAARSWPGRSGALPAATESMARSFLRDGSSFTDFAAVLVAIMIALGLVHRSWCEVELRHSPIFLSLAERPG